MLTYNWRSDIAGEVCGTPQYCHQPGPTRHPKVHQRIPHHFYKKIHHKMNIYWSHFFSYNVRFN
jgi:hypothetical protein